MVGEGPSNRPLNSVGSGLFPDRSKGSIAPHASVAVRGIDYPYLVPSAESELVMEASAYRFDGGVRPILSLRHRHAPSGVSLANAKTLILCARPKPSPSCIPRHGTLGLGS